MRYRFNVDVDFDEPLANAEQGRLAAAAIEALIDSVMWSEVATIPHVAIRVCASQPTELKE